ncbi:hypothetical protein P775_05425 [Puniceibacterium antarcticum]|uniref:Uncharacterized protein n=1 Tax=Puniceibacterium antarcticum TaxID=1206336 RepID=A0A2G8RJH8_9RHOB|nr:hypothetical protein P775_05425 [Puniceibacterium antarcticum]
MTFRQKPDPMYRIALARRHKSQSEPLNISLEISIGPAPKDGSTKSLLIEG